MGGLTESIGHYHRAWSIDSTDTEGPGIECRCINSPERMTWTDYAAHVAEVTEAAVRAQVAGEIRRQWLDAHDREVAAKAWDEGHKAGWEHCQDGNYGTDYWDDDTPNPYRAEADQ